MSAHAIAQRALDFPALLRKNGFAISMQCSSMLKKQPIAVVFEVICAKKLGKGPFKSLDLYRATYVRVNSKLNFFNTKLIVRPIGEYVW